MKVLYCEKCASLVKLTRKHMRSCECGLVRGRYWPKGKRAGKHADVSHNEHTISIAIANESFHEAIKHMKKLESHNPKSNREAYKKAARLEAYARPNSGKGNPRSHKLKD
jgi:hypothetical protein